MTSFGTGNSGTIFEIGTDGSSFSVLHSFTGGGSDGAYPNGSLTLDGQTLYGMTYGGGASNDGVLFSLALPVPEPSNFALLVVAAISLAAWGLRDRMSKKGARLVRI
jgi:uncharacterized repeat protein (TIGR03803 family)